MKKKKLILIPLLLATAVSCQTLETTEDALRLASSATSIYYDYVQNKISNSVTEAKLEAAEKATVHIALQTIEQAKGKLIYYSKNPLELIADIDLVKVEYTKIKIAYTEIRIIILRHWSEYSPATQVLFKRFDREIVKADKEFQALESNILTNERIVLARRVISTGFKIAALM